MNKKGYYFMIDALVAVMILTIGYFLLTAFYASTAPSLEIQRVSENIISLLSDVRLSDLCSDSCPSPDCTIPDMDTIYCSISDKNNTLIESIGELYSKTKMVEAAKIVELIVVDNNLVPRGSNFTLILDNGTHSALIYPENRPFNLNAKVLVPTKKVIFGSYK